MTTTSARIALIFDDRPRPETTGRYCLKALETLASVTHVLPDALSNVSAADFDFVLRVDDGLDYELPELPVPVVWWAIDTHLHPDWYAGQAPSYAHLFCAQQNGAKTLVKRGLLASWLPLACDPEVHQPHDVPLDHELCFIGNLVPGPRVDLLARLKRRWPAMLVDQRYFDEMAKAYSASKIAFNRSVRDDVNMRVFEAMACGALLVTNDLSANGQAELFQDGVHFATYEGHTDLLDKVEWYLRNEEVRKCVAAAGRQKVLAAHTYRHRMEQVLQWWTQRPTRVGPMGGAATVTRPVAKDAAYFDFARPELMALIPASCRRILDIGCGAGALGAALKRERGVYVAGLERDPAAATLAAERLDEIVVGDVEGLTPGAGAKPFDAVVCGDVLEHLRDPAAVLKKLKVVMADGACLIASVPNIRNRAVLGPLLRGNFTYESAGLLDEDHVRFFTRRELEKLFFRAGYAIERLEFVPGPGYDEWASSGRPDRVRVGPLTLEGLPPQEAEEFYAYQYLVVARPRHEESSPFDDQGDELAGSIPTRVPTRLDGLTSIVIPVHNQVGRTRECLGSIRLRTDEPYEIIVVDNGSTDQTVAYFASCGDVRVIRNEENRGFPAAVNQGIAAATGDYILLLNNDTIVTTGWLRRLLDALDRDPNLGMVGPSSNFAGGAQLIFAGYEELEDLDGFAWDLAKAERGRVEETDRLLGFCLLARRAVVEQIGLLDERFGLGNFEDDDWCRRARAAGWKCGIARDAFVHHYGHATFDGANIDLRKLLKRNAELFDKKWRDDQRSQQSPAASVSPTALAPPVFDFVATKDGLKLVPKVRLSATIIVKNNQNTIRACIESLLPWMDEINVVDTGSTDETPEICKALGAKVYYHTWPDSFAAARNYALDYASGEWIFWMDSDDVLPAECGAKLRALALGPHDPAVLGYIMQVHCPHAVEGGEVDWSFVDHVKLFRNRPDLRWEFRIHENILPSIRRAGGDVVLTDIFVVHAGSDQSPEGKRQKLARDYRLLELELQDHPDHPFPLFNLGMTHHDCSRDDEAVAVLKRAIAVASKGDSHLCKAYAFLAGSLARLGRLDEALAACDEALADLPDDVELRFRRSTILLELNRLHESERGFLELLGTKDREARFLSVSTGLTGHKARQNLALVYAAMHDPVREVQQMRLAAAEAPGDPAIWTGLGEALVKLNDLGGVERLAADLRRNDPRPKLLAAACYLEFLVLTARGDLAGSRRVLQDGLARWPDDTRIQQTLAQTLFEDGEWPGARGVLEYIAAAHPTDASAFQNLGVTRLMTKDPSGAEEAFRRSITLRWNAPMAHFHLGIALEDLGRFQEAAEAHEQALRLNPDFRAPRDKLADLRAKFGLGA